MTIIPGQVVQAADYLGGYVGVVIAPEGSFPSEGGFTDTTQVLVTEPGDYTSPWNGGDVVEVTTEALTPIGASA